MNKKILPSITLSMIFATYGLAFGADDVKNTTNETQESKKEEKSIGNNGTKSYKLEKINVTTATGFSQQLQDAPASMSIITGKELQGRPVRDIGDAISQVPGVSIDSTATNFGGYQISIRGMPSSYTLLLVDGARQDVSSEAFPNVSFSQSAFMPPVNAIDRIEVIRGPASTIYGSDAVGGVVNIILKRQFDKWSSNATLETTLQEQANFGHVIGLSVFSAGPVDKAKKWSLMLRAKENYQFNPRTFAIPYPNGTNSSLISGKTSSTGIGDIIGSGQNNQAQAGVRVGYTMDEHNYMYFDVAHFNQWYDPNVFENTFFTRNNMILRHQGSYGENGQIRTDSSIQYNTLFNDSRARLAQDAILEHRTIVPFWKMKLIAGAQYVYNSMTSTNQSGFGAAGNFIDRHTLSIYAEDEYAIIDDFLLTFGARGNINSAFGFNLSPRIYGVYHAIEDSEYGDLVIKGGVSTGYKMPTISQITPGYVSGTGQGRVRVYGDPDLKPESSLNYELTFMHETQYSDISLTGFYTRFKDKITTYQVDSNGVLPASFTCNWQNGTTSSNSSSSSSAPCQSYYNVDSAQSYGLELAAQMKPLDIKYGNIGAMLSYTWNKNESLSGTTKGLPLTGIPEHTLNMAINYDNYGLFGAFIRGEFRANQLRTNVLGRTSTADALDKFRAANPGLDIYYNPYFLVHLGGSYNIKKNLRLNFGIYNLFNHNFIDYYAANTVSSGRSNSSSATTTQTFYNNYASIYEGRRYYISVSMDF